MSGLLRWLTLFWTLGLVFVNGWTDTPTCIATAVGTGALSFRKAVFSSVVFHLAGIFCMAFFNCSVTDTVLSLIVGASESADRLCAAVCAAMMAAVLFSVGAWFFSIPTSESHGLIAGLIGASLALHPAGKENFSAFGKVLLGLFVSVVMAFAIGMAVTRFFQRRLHHWPEKRFLKLEIFSSFFMSFLHGAQDGLKFLGVFVLVHSLTEGRPITGPVRASEQLLPMLLCAGMMALGTACGGRRMVESIGKKLAGLSACQGFSSDLACGICLLFSSLTGILLSTTHTKVTAMVGSAAALKSRVDLTAVSRIIFGWIFTFPVCGALSWLLARLLLDVVS